MNEHASSAFSVPSTPRSGRRVSVDHVSNTRRPVPAPLEANDQLVTAVITAGWAVALITLLAVRTEIPAADRWWIWTCLVGLGLGIFGLLYVPHLKRSRERAARRRAGADSPGPR
jgi:Protein of unknown function (DUF2530)